jgi:hypothetical protein
MALNDQRDELYAALRAKLANNDPLAGERKEIGDEERRNALFAALQQSANQMGSIGGRVVKDTAIAPMVAGLAQSNAAGLKDRADAIADQDKVRSYLLSRLDRKDDLQQQMAERQSEREANLAQRAKLASDDRSFRREMAQQEFGQREKLAQMRANPGAGAATHALDATGAPVPSALAGKQPSKEQFDAATYGRRLEASEGVMDRLAEKGYNRGDVSESLKAYLPGAFQSGDLKSSDQAERNFVNAVLRRESGAAISDKEFDSAKQQYFPRPGDTPEVLAQKKQNRQQAMVGMQAASGSAWDRVPGVPLPPMEAARPESGTAYGATTPAPRPPPPAGKVRVRSPDGKVGLIPAEDLDNAIAEKYEVIN